MNPKRIEELLHLFHERAPIARTFGMKLSFTPEGHAVVELPYNAGLDHGLGAIHGGVYATMLDCAGWFTAAAAHDVSTWVVTSEMSIHLLAPAERTALRAEGRLLKRGKRQHVAEMHLYDEKGELVAHATGTFILLPHVSLMPKHKK
jgi:uncharacterized protein (TIGR00369 family)